MLVNHAGDKLFACAVFALNQNIDRRLADNADHIQHLSHGRAFRYQGDSVDRFLFQSLCFFSKRCGDSQYLFVEYHRLDRKRQKVGDLLQTAQIVFREELIVELVEKLHRTGNIVSGCTFYRSADQVTGR